MTGTSELDIALVGPAFPYRGGIAHFNERILTGASDRGHAASIFTFTRQYPALLFPGKTQETTSDPPPLQPIRCIDSLNPLTWLKAARLIKSRRPGVIVFHHWMPFFAPAFGVIARRLRRSGSRILVVVHNAIPHERRPGDIRLTRYFLSVADGFVVLSDPVERDLRTLGYEQPIRCVQHPTYDNFGPAEDRLLARRKLSLPERGPVLLFFGFIRKYKGLDTLISAMPSIVEFDATSRLVVAGEFYEDEAAYRNRLAELNLGDHVILHSDYIADRDVATYFSAADVVVQPYLSATQSGVAQIAFNYDRPVITTDVGGLAETVADGRTGLVVEPNSPEAIADAVIRFFGENLGERMEEAVSRDKSRFGWQPVFDALYSLSGGSLNESGPDHG
ncbi:MAG: glycosyltransferase [Rhodothermales bacterium]|nr:glycosyltransferase [Rhodothermales bacterium]